MSAGVQNNIHHAATQTSGIHFWLVSALHVQLRKSPGFVVLIIASASGCTFDPSNRLAAANDAGDGVDMAAPGTCDSDREDLLLCLRFEEATGALSLRDESQYQNHANVWNARFVAGHEGLALQAFDGFDSLVPESPSLDPLTGLTIEMWVRPDADVTGNRQGLFDNNGQYGFFVRPDNALSCSTGGPGVTSGANVIVAESWQHVACSYDGAAVKLYVDGIEVQSVDGTGDVEQGGNEGSSFGQNSPDGDEFIGGMDTLRVWGVGLSRQELCSFAQLSCPQ